MLKLIIKTTKIIQTKFKMNSTSKFKNKQNKLAKKITILRNKNNKKKPNNKNKSNNCA